MNNVRCAGRDLWSPVHGQLPGTPCGWKGERFAKGHVTHHEAKHLPIAELQARVLANQNTLRTAKPCPRCGGRVELIPNGGDVA